MVEILAWLHADEGHVVGPLEPARYEAEGGVHGVYLRPVFETRITETATFRSATIQIGDTVEEKPITASTVMNGDTFTVTFMVHLPMDE